MSITEFFKNLVLDAWYKALVYLGGILIVASLFFDVRGISNRQLLFIATGIFLFGLGEWKNRKYLPTIKPPDAYTGPAMFMNMPVWKPDIIGISLDLSGIALIIIGVRAVILNI